MSRAERGYLALGANVGDRRASLEAAARRLSQVDGIALLRTAGIYETAAIGPVAQGPFLNTVAEIETTLAPEALLDRCLGIEEAMGRVRRERQGPRPIDIDILWLAGVAIDSPRLRIPHPEAHRRRFVLVPLQELAPSLILGGKPLSFWIGASEPRAIAAVP